MPIGTLINTITVLIGSLIGLKFRSLIPERINAIIFQAIGLFTLVLGFQMAIGSKNPLILVFSLILGGLLGEAYDLEKRMSSISEKIKSRFKINNEKFTEGLITSFLLFCIGSMTIVGSINEGVSGDRSLLITKSILDGFSSIALSASLGSGVVFSAIPLFLFQGGLTLVAGQLQQFVSTFAIGELTATGGVLIVGIGINLLNIQKIKVLNLLPALVFSVVFATILEMLNLTAF